MSPASFVLSPIKERGTGGHKVSHKLRRQNIRERTEEYWECRRNRRCNYDCYIQYLLGRELDYANKHPLPGGIRRLRRLDKPVHTLALTVGESFEPLLQVVCVLQPRRLTLILNKSYGTTSGTNQGEAFCRLVKKLSTASDLPDEFRPGVDEVDFDLIQVEPDTPTAVFRAIRDALQKQEAKPGGNSVNAVDITGAKKSMVVGAFLYAAHSGLPITYVDFDEYNPDFGKPYGYLCQIGQIADPYQAFHLRDWEQVRQLYERYNFRRAQELIGTAATMDKPGSGILGAMSSQLEGKKAYPPLYDPEDIARVERLAQILSIYEAWDNGEFRQAKKLAGELQPTLPPDVVPWAIAELGDFWPSAIEIADAGNAARQLLEEHLKLKHGEDKPTDSIFGRPPPLLAYTRDELAKIDRLIAKNEDYRSAFLRAAGLHEFLLKARLALCWLNGGLQVCLKGSKNWQSVGDLGEGGKELFHSLTEQSGERKMRIALSSDPPKSCGIQGVSICRCACSPRLEPYWSGLELDLDKSVYVEGGKATPVFVKLRGEAIHTHLYIPRHVAEAARDLAQKAVAEFETKWLEHYHQGTLQVIADKSVESPKWRKLCKVCGLDFLPPKLRN
jgi:hypothetical protein